MGHLDPGNRIWAKRGFKWTLCSAVQSHSGRETGLRSNLQDMFLSLLSAECFTGLPTFHRDSTEFFKVLPKVGMSRQHKRRSFRVLLTLPQVQSGVSGQTLTPGRCSDTQTHKSNLREGSTTTRFHGHLSFLRQAQDRSERPQGVKNLVSGWQFFTAKRDSSSLRSSDLS